MKPGNYILTCVKYLLICIGWIVALFYSPGPNAVFGQTTIFTSGFETGNSTFTSSAGASTTITQPTASNPRSGTESGKFVATANNTIFTGSIITSSTVTFTSGKYYRFTVWAKRVENPSSTLSIKKSATATNAAMISASGSDVLLAGSSLNVSSTTYTKLVGAILASATESDKYVGIQIVSDKAGGQLSTAYIDDFTIEESTTPFAENYCKPVASISSAAGHITNVTFPASGGINRTSTYDDYVNGGVSADITINESYVLSVTKTTVNPASITAYIDWDGNGVYSDGVNALGDNEKVMVYSSNSTAAQTQSITVPTAAVVGATNMRVIFKYNAAVSGPCDATSTYYDVEDYQLNILAGCTTPVTQATLLTSSSIGTTSMTVGWTRGNGDAGVVVVARAAAAVNADVENGTSYSANAAFGSGTEVGTGNYVVYVGTGTSVDVTALASLTSYYFAVYEYNTTSTCYLKSELTGNATTLAATYTSNATGNWDNTATWVGGVVPTINENAIIADGHTVTITSAANCNDLTVGQGASGILIFEATTARTLTVGGSVTIASGGSLQSAATGTQTAHVLSIAGNLTNNGTLDFSTNSNTAAVAITFTGASNATFSGTGGTTDIRAITINKGTSTSSVLELSTTNFTVRGVDTDVASFLTLTKGTFKISGSFTMTNRVLSGASTAIPANTGLYLNNANFTVEAQAGLLDLNGLLQIDAGTYNVGTSSTNHYLYSSGAAAVFTMNGGVLNVYSCFNFGQLVYTQTGGILTAVTGVNTTAASFYLGAASTFNMSGGTIVLRFPGSGVTSYVNFAGTRTVTAGTLQLGDASSGTAKTYIAGGYIPNFLLTNTSGNHTCKFSNLVSGSTYYPTVLLTTTLQDNTTLDAGVSYACSNTFTGDLTISTGSTLTVSSRSITLNGNWINNGTFTTTTGTVTFSGAANNTISGSSTTSFYNLTVNKGTDTTYCIEATGPMGMTGQLALTNGVLKLTHASSSAQITASLTIPSTGGLWVNGGSFSYTGSLTVWNDGLIRISAGTGTFAPTAGYRIENRTTGKFFQTGGVFVGGWRFYNDGGFTMSNGTMTLNTLASSASANATFESTATSTFTMTGGTIVIQNENTGAGGDLVITSGAGTKTITGGTFQIGNASTPASKIFLINCNVPLYNLTVFSTNAPTARLKTSALTVSNAVTISGGILDAKTNGLDVTVGGDWINNSGTTVNSKIGFDSGSKKVTFNGGAAQTISGTAITTFHDFDLANTSGDVALAVNATVNNSLILTSGKLSVQGYTLTVGTDGANGSISGGSSTAYVEAYDNGGTIGYLKQFINAAAGTAYSFPIGDASNYAPLTFTLTTGSLASAYLTLYTVGAKITGLNPSITQYINRSWEIGDVGITTPTYTVAYTYADGDIVGGTETGLVPIKISGSTWYKPTGSEFTTGTEQGEGSVDAGSNTLTWSGLTNFCLFGGCVGGPVALPIELISFSGHRDGANNLLRWETATELNNDFFTIEKTTDGDYYEIVGTENAAGNSTQLLAYELTDYNVRQVINYYRLKQTDFDGKYTFSKLISVDNRASAANKEIVLIINILGQEVNEFYRGIVIIHYADGTSRKIVQ
jgi:hypothetical protein